MWFPKALILLPSALAASCVAAGVPPSLVDLGTTAQAPGGELRTGLRVSAGAQWASATINRKENHDLGFGYVYERLEGAGGDIRTKNVAPNAPDQVRSSQGVYLSFAKVLARDLDEHHRTWLGVRAEYLNASAVDGGPSLNLLARASWEIFGPVTGAGGAADSCAAVIGISHGTVGLGLYAEAGARRSLEGEASFATTAGVSIRLPALFGLGAGWCR